MDVNCSKAGVWRAKIWASLSFQITSGGFQKWSKIECIYHFFSLLVDQEMFSLSIYIKKKKIIWIHTGKIYLTSVQYGIFNLLVTPFYKSLPPSLHEYGSRSRGFGDPLPFIIWVLRDYSGWNKWAAEKRRKWGFSCASCSFPPGCPALYTLIWPTAELRRKECCGRPYGEWSHNWKPD